MINERYKIVPCGIDVDINSATDNVADSINMKGAHKCTFVIQYVDLGTANHTVLVYSGASDAARTSAMPFKYAFASAATGSANCDVLTDWTDCATTGLAVAHDTYDNYLLMIEVDAANMDVANSENWLTLDFQDTGDAGATGQAVVFAILEPRYAGNQSATVLA